VACAVITCTYITPRKLQPFIALCMGKGFLSLRGARLCQSMSQSCHHEEQPQCSQCSTGTLQRPCMSKPPSPSQRSLASPPPACMRNHVIPTSTTQPVLLQPQRHMPSLHPAHMCQREAVGVCAPGRSSVRMHGAHAAR
jgi:hypothetical protein